MFGHTLVAVILTTSRFQVELCRPRLTLAAQNLELRPRKEPSKKNALAIISGQGTAWSEGRSIGLRATYGVSARYKSTEPFLLVLSRVRLQSGCDMEWDLAGTEGLKVLRSAGLTCGLLQLISDRDPLASS